MAGKTEKEGKAPSILRRVARGAVQLSVTAAVLVGSGALVQVGTAELTRRADAALGPEAAAPIPVSVRPIAFEDGYEVTRGFVGQVEPQRSVALSFELAGLLADIRVDEGDAVSAGDILALQDTALLKAERRQLLASRDALTAQLTFAQQTVARSEELTQRGFSTQAGLDEALARQSELTSRIAEVDAGLANVDIRVAKAALKAPFDGRVTARPVDGGEALAPGQAVLQIVETGPPHVRVGVPLSFDAARLDGARIAVAGTEYDARLITLRPDIEPITRTRTALFAVQTEAHLAFGQTAQLMTTQRVPARGLWVPLTALREGVRGQWTLLVRDAEGVVRAASVEILHTETDRVFVRGAFPEGTQLIDDGPQRVTPGQRVVVAVR